MTEKTTILLLAVIIQSMFCSAEAQESCRVLLPAIDSIYSGECRGGLAHGTGEASGVDHYAGNFRRGLPHGEGVYRYADGPVYEGSFRDGLRHGEGRLKLTGTQADSIITGIWERDKYIGPVPAGPGYKISRKLNVERYRVYREGEGNRVLIKLSMTTSGSPGVSGVSITGSTGIEFQYSGFYGFESITFPFTSVIRCGKWNKLRTAMYEVNFEIEITEPGNWVIELF